MAKKSTTRVQEAAEVLGLDITLQTMPQSTRTAEEAADACGCSVGQIVKSLVFEGAESGQLVLLLVSGAYQVDTARAAGAVGEPLGRADAKKVREVTGFAIGGVSPIGHLSPISIWMDQTLMAFDIVWAAAGAPNTVFAIAPQALQTATDATVCDLTG